MPLVRLSYAEYEDEPHHWDITDATFLNINLIVGKNSSGKSRLLSVTNSLARLICGQHKPFESCKFLAILELNNREFSYQIELGSGAVISEILKVNGEEKLNRGSNGLGTIHYEKEKKSLEFKLPPDAVAAVNRRDEIQHSFLIELHEWASGVVLYLFGTDFGKTQLMPIIAAQALLTNPIPQVDDPNHLAWVYSKAFTRFGEAFDKAILADMNALGYSLTDVGCENIQDITKFPVAALAMYTVESDLGFKNAQVNLSQGMFRALALSVHLNLCAFSKNKQLILVDDIGEGLDFERTVAMIDLLINKAEENDMQLVMTSNDRFVMNRVPLKYWSVLKRKGGVVKMFNLENSQKQFEDFKYLGLNNFDFFASEFFDAEVVND